MVLTQPSSAVYKVHVQPEKSRGIQLHRFMWCQFICFSSWITTDIAAVALIPVCGLRWFRWYFMIWWLGLHPLEGLSKPSPELLLHVTASGITVALAPPAIQYWHTYINTYITPCGTCISTPCGGFWYTSKGNIFLDLVFFPWSRLWLVNSEKFLIINEFENDLKSLKPCLVTELRYSPMWSVHEFHKISTQPHPE